VGRREAICPRDDLSRNVTRAFCGSRADIQRGRMFPDVRLMVAATLASVVALMFGFGLFAAFRVSHEPLGRLQPAGAPLQLVADNAAITATTIAPGEPFDRRFQSVAAPTVSATVNVPTPGPDLDDDVETSSVAAPTASTKSSAAARDGTSAIGEPKDQPALPALQPVEAPSDTSVTATAPASDQPASAPQAESATLAAAELHDSISLAAAVDKTAIGQENKSDVATAASTEPAAAPSIAAVDAGKDWRQDWTRPPPTTQRPNTDAATASAGRRVARAAGRTIEKKVRLASVVARPQRPRKAATAVALRTADRNNGFERSNFQTAPQARTQLVPRHVVRIRHAYIAPDRIKERDSAVGGPYVSP
jgi:hypothetical protein